MLANLRKKKKNYATSFENRSLCVSLFLPMVHLRRSEAAASEGEKRLSTIGEDNGGKLILLVGNVGRLK